MPDLIVNAGLAIATGLLTKITTAEPKYLQWGTGTTAPAAGNTALQTALNEARVSGTVTRVTTTAADDTMQVVGTLTNASGGTVNVTELGSFDAAGSGTPATGGNMFSRSTFTAIPVDNGGGIAFTVKTVATSA
jgi:hypothetical protein